MSRREPNGGPPDPSTLTVEHVCLPPRWMRRSIIGLMALVALCLIGLGVGGSYIWQANEYVQGRGEYRDREVARLEESIRDSICDLLDQLPEGGLLDRPRAKYGCGPGIPLGELPPDQAEQLQRQRGGSAPAPSPPAPAAPSAERPQAAPGPPIPPSPSPTTEPPPVIDLRPLGNATCELVRACF